MTPRVYRAKVSPRAKLCSQLPSPLAVNVESRFDALVILRSMRRHIQDRSSAPMLIASTMSSAGPPKRSSIVISMTNIQLPPSSSAVFSLHARISPSARAIASNTWKRLMAGTTCVPRQMAPSLARAGLAFLLPLRVRRPHHHHEVVLH